MARILLTNDDGIAAPGLVAFAEHLASIGDVAVVVPDRERSWVGKAITRYDPVTVTRVDREGVTIHACSGYPADCVQLGTHTLFPEPPDMVVSGINVGYNHGSAYLQSSGTAGAALEASISRVPAIAFSAGSLTVPWNDWKLSVLEPEARPMWERLAAVATDICRRALGVTSPGDVINVGLPDTAEIETERRVTRVARVGYDRLFAETAPGIYSHAYGGLVFDGEDLSGTDVVAARDEVVSITPIRGVGNADPGVSRALLEALTR
jgi:5'-nucleotidase